MKPWWRLARSVVFSQPLVFRTTLQTVEDIPVARAAGTSGEDFVHARYEVEFSLITRRGKPAVFGVRRRAATCVFSAAKLRQHVAVSVSSWKIEIS